MSEIYFLASGPYHWLKVFEAHMQSQFIPLEIQDAIGNKRVDKFYGILEPVQLYRYIIPNAALGVALKTLKADQPFPQVPSAYQWAMRKAFGLKEIDKKIIPNVNLPVGTDHIQILTLGVKDEPPRLFADTGSTQEPI